jgi:hypothetical protein
MDRMRAGINQMWHQVLIFWQQQVVPRWQRFWPWYRTASRRTQVGIGCGSLLALAIVCSCAGIVLGLGGTTPAGQQALATAPGGSSATTPYVPRETPTPRPTDTATPQPTATLAPLALTFTCAQAVDNSYGKVCVHTHPGAQLTITVTYCSGRAAKSASLGPANGDHTWQWVPQTTCKGPATAVVAASWGGNSATNSTTFTVQ